jgi:hypothetical protein
LWGRPARGTVHLSMSDPALPVRCTAATPTPPPWVIGLLVRKVWGNVC